MKRRNFVKTLASLAAVGSLPGVASAAGSALTGGNTERVQGPAAVSPRALGAAKYGLEINGTDVGFLESVEGGNAVADVITDASGGKRLGALAYEPFRLALAMPPHPDVTKLINESFGGARPSTIAVVGYDLNYKVISYREATNAFLSEIAVEPLDAAAGKNAVSLMLGVSAEVVRSVEKAGAAGKVGAKAKGASNFRFAISGLESASNAVVKVALPSAKLKVQSKGAAGKGGYELSTFTVELTSAGTDPYLEWFEKFAIKRSDTEERTAKLELLGADLKTVLYTVSLSGVGIAALRAQKQEAGSEKLSRMEATLYAERIAFEG